MGPAELLGHQFLSGGHWSPEWRFFGVPPKQGAGGGTHRPQCSAGMWCRCGRRWRCPEGLGWRGGQIHVGDVVPKESWGWEPPSHGTLGCHIPGAGSGTHPGTGKGALGPLGSSRGCLQVLASPQPPSTAARQGGKLIAKTAPKSRLALEAGTPGTPTPPRCWGDNGESGHTALLLGLAPGVGCCHGGLRQRSPQPGWWHPRGVHASA